jgi:ribonuclease M5
LIKEVIVVEGKDDINAVKKAVEAEVIATSGFGISEATFKKIENAAERCGVIIFTDPDFAGEKIRKRISERVPSCKHAFLPRVLALRDGDIGIENASPESIISALSKVKTEVEIIKTEFSMDDLMRNGLTGFPMSSDKRDLLGAELGIGYGNAKQFLNRLNKYGITREEFNYAVERIKV